MRGCVCECGYGNDKNAKIKYREYLIYNVRMRARFRMIFKYTEVVCGKPHDVSHMNSYSFISSHCALGESVISGQAEVHFSPA